MLNTAIPLIGAIVPIAAASLFYIGDRRSATNDKAHSKGDQS